MKVRIHTILELKIRDDMRYSLKSSSSIELNCPVQISYFVFYKKKPYILIRFFSRGRNLDLNFKKISCSTIKINKQIFKDMYEMKKQLGDRNLD